MGNYRVTISIAGVLSTALVLCFLVLFQSPNRTESPVDSEQSIARTTTAASDHSQPRNQEHGSRKLWQEAAAADIVLHESRIAQDLGEQRLVIAQRPQAPYPLVRAVETWKTDEAGVLQLQQREEMVADHILVTAADGVDINAMAAMAKRLGYTIRAQVGSRNRFLISFPINHPLGFDGVREQLAQADEVRFAEPDHYYYWLGTVPNDPRLSDMWSLINEGQEGGLMGEDIAASAAWSITTGHRGVMVGVIDSGVEIDHEDLAANIWRNPYEFISGIDESGTGFADDIHGWNFSSNNNNVGDVLGHGTHVAGTIGAVGNNGIGVTGVAWDVSIVPIAFSGGLTLQTSVLVPAIEYSITLGIPITNNSWGNFIYSETMRETIAAAGEAGQLFVAAAGNSDSDSDIEPIYPASYDLDNVIAVAATNRHGEISDFSSYGATTVHVAAPGEDIFSTHLRDAYHTLSGTSMAAPHVAGVAALMLSVNPHLTPSQMRSILMDTGDPHGTASDKQTISGKRVNADRALRAAMGDATAMADVVAITVLDNGSNGSIGNGDGQINPGETLAILGDLRSYGLGDSENVSVWLEVVEGSMSILTPAQTFPSLTRGSVTSLEPMLVKVDDAALAPQRLRLALHIHLENGHNRQQELVYPLFDQVQISGQVRREDTGQPIANATVSLGGPESTTITTDSEGRYSYATLAGLWKISVSSPGLLTETVTTTVSSDTDIDFLLGAPEMVLSPVPFVIPLAADGKRHMDLNIGNTGNRLLEYQIRLVDQLYGLRDSRYDAALDWQWEDIRTAGTPVSFPSSGSGSPVLDIGFAMPLFDTNYEVLQIGSNGFITLGDRTNFSSQSWGFGHVVLPNFRGLPYKIAAMWTNLGPHRGGSVHYLRRPDTFIVQFTEVPRGRSDGDHDHETSTFQMHLHANGVIDFYYLQLAPSFRDFFTVGMQQGQQYGFTHIYNEDLLDNETRLQWHPRLIAQRYRGSIAAGDQESLPFTARAIGLEPGDYQHQLRVFSNDPSQEDQTIAITLRVLAEPIRAISMRLIDGLLWQLNPHSETEHPYVLDDDWQHFEAVPSAEDHHLEVGPPTENQ